MPTPKQFKSFLIRKMPVELVVKIKILAASRGITMEKLIIQLLTKCVKSESAGEHNAD